MLLSFPIFYLKCWSIRGDVYMYIYSKLLQARQSKLSRETVCVWSSSSDMQVDELRLMDPDGANQKAQVFQSSSKGRCCRNELHNQKTVVADLVQSQISKKHGSQHHMRWAQKQTVAVRGWMYFKETSWVSFSFEEPVNVVSAVTINHQWKCKCTQVLSNARLRTWTQRWCSSLRVVVERSSVRFTQ